jgi:hypothetical protein
MRCARRERLLRTISQESGNYVGVAMACCANLAFVLLVLVSASIDVGPVAGIPPRVAGGAGFVHPSRLLIATARVQMPLAQPTESRSIGVGAAG